MKITDFLLKLKKEKKLQIVEESTEIAQAYLKKSESYLSSAKLLFENKRLEESISMAYYSMYHMLTALLFRTGIKCENHSASIVLLKKVYGLDNSNIAFAKRERIDKQYYVDFHLTKEDTKELIEKAEEFNKELFDFISRLSNPDVIRYKGEFKKLLK